MKKILLLAAVAAPLAMSAQTTPAAPAAWQWLQYDLPAGTFYPASNAAAAAGAQQALIPAGTPLTWTNTSYYIGEFGTPTPWQPGTFSWGYYYYGVPQTADTYNLETSADFAPLTAVKTPVAAPTMTPNSAEGVQIDCYTGVLYGASNIAGSYYTFNPAGATIADSKLYSFDSGSDELGSLWAAQTDAYSNINVSGFAQRIEYPGVPYILTSIEMGTLGAGSSYVLSIYEAPADSSLTLPEKPLQVFTSTDGSGITANGPVELSTYNGTPVLISTPILVVVSQINGTFTSQVKMETPDASKPAVTNHGAYAVAEVENADGATETVLIPSTAQADGETGIATAIAMKVGMHYPFLQPVSIVGSDEFVSSTKPLTLNFNNSYNAASVRIASSVTDINDIVLPEYPEWINLTVEKPSAADVQAAAGNTTATPADAQYFIANIAVNSAVTNSAELTFGVPGAETTITVNSTIPSGIDNVASPEAEVVGREYFDLSGRRLNAAPVKGFYIEKSIRADGSTTSVSRLR